MSPFRAKGEVCVAPLKKIWISSIWGSFPVSACEEVCWPCGEPADSRAAIVLSSVLCVGSDAGVLGLSASIDDTVAGLLV